MSLPAATVWEIEAGGSVNNGGGFVAGASGTDWSQQSSPQYALTGIASSGSGNTVLSAAAASDMVGNVAQAISGTNINPGFYEVVSVVVGVSITFSQNNASVSICSGVAASGVINIGGALAAIATAVGQLQTGHTVWVKGGTPYSQSSATTIQLAGGNSAFNISFMGYTTSRGDNGQPTITTATNSIDLFDYTQSYGILWKNFIFTNTAGTPGAAHQAKTTNLSSVVICVNCSFSGFKYAFLGDNTVNWQFGVLFLYNCEIKNCTSHGIFNSGTTHLLGCFIHGNTGDGVRLQSGTNPQSLIDCQNSIIYNNGGAGLNNQGNQAASTTEYRYIRVVNSAIANNTGDGITSTVGASTLGSAVFTINSIYYSNGGFGINTAGSNNFTGPTASSTNAFGANTSGARSGFPAAPGDINLSATPFTNASGNDFSLNSTSGGGAACKAAGFPGVLQIGGTGSADIGALQSSGGGGGTTVIVAPTQIRILKQGR